MITFERFEELNQHRWSDDEMQKNYAIALEVEKNYMEKFGSIKEPKLGDIVEFSDGFHVYKNASIVAYLLLGGRSGYGASCGFSCNPNNVVSYAHWIVSAALSLKRWG